MVCAVSRTIRHSHVHLYVGDKLNRTDIWSSKPEDNHNHIWLCEANLEFLWDFFFSKACPLCPLHHTLCQVVGKARLWCIPRAFLYHIKSGVSESVPSI